MSELLLKFFLHLLSSIYQDVIKPIVHLLFKCIPSVSINVKLLLLVHCNTEGNVF